MQIYEFYPHKSSKTLLLPPQINCKSGGRAGTRTPRGSMFAQRVRKSSKGGLKSAKYRKGALRFLIKKWGGPRAEGGWGGS